jgi:hypothetical protein
MGSPKLPPPCFFAITPSPLPKSPVDDFLVRYSHPSELEHLVPCLSTLYELKVHRDLPRYTYLNYTVDYSATPPSPCMTLSMPNYIPSMLSHFCPSGCGSASSSAIYTPPVSPTDSSITTPSSTATLYLSLCRREDMDPTSSWVFALLCQSPGPIPPHRSLPTLLPSIYYHATRSYLCPPPPLLCLIPPQPPQNHTPLLHGSLGLYRRQLLVPT